MIGKVFMQLQRYPTGDLGYLNRVSEAISVEITVSEIQDLGLSLQPTK